MKIKKDFMKHKIAGETVVVPVRQLANEFEGMVSLNSSAEFLWDSLKENDLTRDELVDRYYKEYEVTEEIAERDVDNFVKVLKDNGFLE